MPLPAEASFRKKGEYAPAANDDGGNETTPYKPVPLTFNQADATTIRNRENDRMNNDHDLTPLTFERRRSPTLCPNRRTCIIIVVVGVIIFFTLVLPLALTYGRKSNSTKDSSAKADSGKLQGNISLVVSSNSTNSNSSFEDFVRKPRVSGKQPHDRQVRKVSEFSSEEDSALKPLKVLIIEALTIYSHLCTMNKCNDATLSDFELHGDRINAGFAMQLSKGQMPILVADQSMLKDVESTMMQLFPQVYPNFTLEQVKTDVDFESFCTIVNCGNATEISFMHFINEPTNETTSANVTTEEAEWRDLNDDDYTTVTPQSVSSTPLPTTAGRQRTAASSVTSSTTLTTISITLLRTSRITTTEVPPLVVIIPDQANPQGNCSTSGFACLSGNQYIPLNQRCDGFPNCIDGSDETNCTECRTSLSCPSSIGKRCLRGERLCDKKRDCLDGFDESEFCRSECSRDEYKCATVNKCVPQNLLCDGDSHCPDKDDETVCISKGTFEVTNVGSIFTNLRIFSIFIGFVCFLCCTNNAKWCVADSRCIPVWSLCDDKIDCSDGSDEEFCPCPKRFAQRKRN